MAGIAPILFLFQGLMIFFSANQYKRGKKIFKESIKTHILLSIMYILLGIADLLEVF